MPPRRELGRRTGSRRPRRTILIVCEGEATEYLYFLALKRDYHLANTSIDVVASRRDKPAIVAEAMRRANQERFDEVWCVFDREFPPDDANFLAAITAAGDAGFNLAPSNPAFEFWLLLHFRYTTQAFADNSQLLAALRREFASYQKNRECYSAIRGMQDRAIAHAEQVLREQERTSPDERFPHPSTYVHCLVQRLASQREFRG